MKLYIFSDWFAGDQIYGVSEHEAEEKPNSYVYKENASDRIHRINKSDINRVTGDYCNTMACLENDPALFLEGVMHKIQNKINYLNNCIKQEEEKFKKYQTKLNELKSTDKKGDN